VLRGTGCDLAQGFYLSRPLTAGTAETLIAGRSIAQTAAASRLSG